MSESDPRPGQPEGVDPNTDAVPPTPAPQGPETGDEDALLNAIRSAVSEEVAHVAPAAPPGVPFAKPAPLVLGAGVRVSDGTPPADAPMYDEPELRGRIGELVREELEQALGAGMEARIRSIVRAELGRLLAKARQG